MWKKVKLCHGTTKTPWESAPEHDVDWYGASLGELPTGIKRRKMVCPRCKRRVTSSIRICDDGCCIVHYIPPHKPRYWWKKGKRRK